MSPHAPVVLDIAGTTLSRDDRRRLKHPLTGGLILFARHPEFLLGDWKTAVHRADGGFVLLVQEFLPVGLRGLLLAVLISAVQARSA